MVVVSEGESRLAVSALEFEVRMRKAGVTD